MQSASGSLPPLPTLEHIEKRLPVIFPEGTPARNYVIRATAAKTVFVMFYVGAVQQHGDWLRPNQVVRMTDMQAALRTDPERRDWTQQSLKKRSENTSGHWFADTSREPIRDETIKDGLLRLGAVIEREELAPSSSKPRYALEGDFADLFQCTDAEFELAAQRWQKDHLTVGSQARLLLLRKGIAAGSTSGVDVVFPNGQVRRMSAGASSAISKQVIEVFATKFLERPAVVWLSESRAQVVESDHNLAKMVGLSIDAQDILPDIILIDVRRVSDPLIVFVEVVASDGPIKEGRKHALLELAGRGGHDASNTAFVTAFMDRSSPAYKRTVPDIAWGTFIWFASEPDKIIYQYDPRGQPILLTHLLKV